MSVCRAAGRARLVSWAGSRPRAGGRVACKTQQGKRKRKKKKSKSGRSCFRQIGLSVSYHCRIQDVRRVAYRGKPARLRASADVVTLVCVRDCLTGRRAPAPGSTIPKHSALLTLKKKSKVGDRASDKSAFRFRITVGFRTQGGWRTGEGQPAFGLQQT